MRILAQSAILAGLSLASAAFAADVPARDFDLMNSMSAADFRATGLDKLSDAQIKALNAWFGDYQRQHVLACGAAAPSATAAGAPASTPTAADTYPLSAHIAGEFHGWSGSTRVTLDNGQVWEQMDDAVVTSARVTNPKVTVSRGLLNAFYMSVEGTDDTVLVKRIKN